MKSVEDKLKIIKERVFCKEMPPTESAHCKILLMFLRKNIDILHEDNVLRIYGPNPHDAQYSAVYDKYGNLIFGPPLKNKNILKMPQISFLIKDIRDKDGR